MRIPVNDPDEPLVRSYQENHDRKSFEFLYDKYKDDIFNYCYKFLNDEDDASDCTQEIFIRTFRHLNTYRYQSRFSTWLFRITINACKDAARDKLKKSKLRSLNMSEKIHESAPDPEKILSEKEAGLAFQVALNKLKNIQKSVLILRDLEGRSYDEIARISKLNPGTVRSTLARARYKMANYLKEYKNEL